MYCTAPLSPPKGRLTSFHDDDDDDDDDDDKLDRLTAYFHISHLRTQHTVVQRYA